MRGAKSKDSMVMNKDREFEVMEDWPWVNPTYEFEIPCKLKEVQQIIIDPTWRMADIERGNNEWKKTN